MFIVDLFCWTTIIDNIFVHFFHVDEWTENKYTPIVLNVMLL